MQAKIINLILTQIEPLARYYDSTGKFDKYFIVKEIIAKLEHLLNS